MEKVFLKYFTFSFFWFFFSNTCK